MTSEYCVVNHQKLAELVLAVNEKIKDGWQPLGGIQFSICAFEKNAKRTTRFDEPEMFELRMWAQAMVKE